MRPRIQDYNNMMDSLFGDGKRMIRAVTVQVTDACNLRCTYCYQIAKCNHFIDIDIAKKYLTEVLEGNNPYINFENTSGMILDLIGGEPLMAIDTITELVDWVMDYMISHHHPWFPRFRISISSNGTLYFNPKVQEFLRKYSSFISIGFSIDGNKELHDTCRLLPDGSGSYDIAVAAVKHWAKTYNKGEMPTTKMTLSPDNIKYFCDAHINMIENLGYFHINCNCCFEEGWTIEHANILYHEMCKLTDWLFDTGRANDVYISIYDNMIGGHAIADKNWCGGTGEMIAVDWKGDIYPCIRYMESSLGDDQPPIKIGNVDRGIATTQEELKCIECLHAITLSSQSTQECIDCPISQGCAWCSGYNYQKFGTPNKRATFICCMHKARIMANLYFWKKWNLTYPDDSEQGCLDINIPDEWAIEIIGQEEWDKLKAFVQS